MDNLLKLGKNAVSVVLTIALATTMTPSEAWASVAKNSVSDDEISEVDSSMQNSKDASDDSQTADKKAEDESVVNDENQAQKQSSESEKQDTNQKQEIQANPTSNEEENQNQNQNNDNNIAVQGSEPQVPVDAIASGEMGTITWYITAAGVLTFVPTANEDGSVPDEGVYSERKVTGYEQNPWNQYAKQIVSVNASGRGADQYADVDNAHPKKKLKFNNLDYLFGGLWNLSQTKDEYNNNQKRSVIDMSGIAICDDVEDASISHLIDYTEGVEVLDLKGMDTCGITNWEHAFSYNEGIKKVIFDTDDNNRQGLYATNLTSMFEGCSQLEEAELSHFYATKATNLFKMFNACDQLLTVDLSGLGDGVNSHSEVESVQNLFSNCLKLSEVKLPATQGSNLKLSNVSDVFYNAKSLKNLDLSRWNFNNVSGYSSSSFQNCYITNLSLELQAI